MVLTQPAHPSYAIRGLTERGKVEDAAHEHPLQYASAVARRLARNVHLAEQRDADEVEAREHEAADEVRREQWARVGPRDQRGDDALQEEEAEQHVDREVNAVARIDRQAQRHKSDLRVQYNNTYC